MNTRRRLALVIVALPLAFYGYACSSDSTDTPAGEDGGDGTDTGTKPDSSTGTDGSTGTDSSTGKDSSTVDAADASDGAVPIVCIGNPLTADGGNLDGGVNLDAAVATQIVSVAAGNFLDGPTWFDANGGFLVYSEFDQTERLWRIAADGGAKAQFRDAGLDNNNGPVGNAVRNGLLVTAVDAKTGTGVPKFLVSTPDGGALPSIGIDASVGATVPNDLVVGPVNNIYFTDGQYQATPAGTTGLYRILGTDGGIQAIQQNFGRANGIAISPDNTKLYVGVGPLNAGDPDKKKVLVYDVAAATGVVTAPGATFLAEADLGDVPDGMAVDVGGNLWVAEATINNAPGGRVEVFSPAKKKLGTIPFATERPTGVAFGGADNKTLFITTETGVFTYVSRCAGVR